MISLSVAHMLGHAAQSEIRANASRCTLYLIPPPVMRGISLFDFRHGATLMDAGRTSAREWLTSREPVSAER
jgi:hypothetical protein